jgi:hypothetical protein
VLGEDPSAALRIVDTAPEVNADRALGHLREADRALVPVKGPEAGSVLALPLLLDWLEQANGARLLGFLPTMYNARRGDSRQWLGNLSGSLVGLALVRTHRSQTMPVLHRFALRGTRTRR